MLTPEETANIIMLMRVSSLLSKHPEIVNKNPELKEKYEALKGNIDYVMTRLSDEEKDELLERYRIEAENLGLSQPDEEE